MPTPRLALKTFLVNGKIYASDLNQSLIATYKNIQANPHQIITLTQHLAEQYQRCRGNIVNRRPTSIEEATTSQESYYYWHQRWHW